MSDPLPSAPKYPVPGKPAVPKEVNIAFAVWVLSSLVSSVLQALDVDVFVEAFLKQPANQPPGAQLSAGAVRGIFYIALVVVGALMLLFAWKMRSGRNWARVLLTALAVFGLYTQASAVGFSDWIAVVSVAITATGLVYMYMPPSNAYFRSFRTPPPPR